MEKKLIVGITGGSGTGKTSILKYLESLGAYIIDADLVARKVVEPDKPALFEITEHFGSGVINPDGTLARKKLGDIVFSDSRSLGILNEITHKYIKKEILDEINSVKNTFFAIDAAELHEGGLAHICTFTVAILASREIRKERIMVRDGLTEKQAENRILSQKNDDYYIKKCDYFIKNDAEFDDAAKKMQKIIDDIGRDYVQSFKA